MVFKEVFSYAVLLSLAAFSFPPVDGQTFDRSSVQPCSEVTMLSSQPLSALPSSIQEQILSALKPSILSFAKATAEDLEEDFRLHKIKLDAIQVSQTGESGAVYVVHWGLAEFGVNGAVWIVEVNSQGARNLVASGNQAIGASSFSGWGMQVLSRKDPHYPEIMIASKGFARPGLPEARAECVRKIGSVYKMALCPTHCFRNLNSR
jgi:hypothetical protein